MVDHEKENSLTNQFIEHFELNRSYEKDVIDRVKDIVKIKKWEVDWEVDWGKFYKLEPSYEGYNERLHFTAISLLDKIGVLSMDPGDNYGLLIKGVAGSFNCVSMNGIQFYFTRKEDAKAYAKVKWGKQARIVHVPKGTKIEF